MITEQTHKYSWTIKSRRIMRSVSVFLMLGLVSSVNSNRVFATSIFPMTEQLRLIALSVQTGILADYNEIIPTQHGSLPPSFSNEFKKFGDLSGSRIEEFTSNNPEYLMATIKYLEQLKGSDHIDHQSFTVLLRAAFAGLKQSVTQNNNPAQTLSLQRRVVCSSEDSTCISQTLNIQSLKIRELGLCNSDRCVEIFSNEKGFDAFAQNTPTQISLSKVRAGTYTSIYLVTAPTMKLSIRTKFDHLVVGSKGGIGSYCTGYGLENEMVSLNVHAVCFPSPTAEKSISLRLSDSDRSYKFTQGLRTHLEINERTKGLALSLDIEQSLTTFLSKGVISYTIKLPIIKVAAI